MNRFFPESSRLLAALSAGAFMILPGSLHAAEGTAAAAAKRDLPSIVVTTPVERKLVDRVAASGTIRPVEEVLVQPQVEGLAVERFNVDIGDRIEAGAVLAELSKESLQIQQKQAEASKARAEAALAQAGAQVSEAQASYEDAVRQRDRAVTLGRTGTVAASQVEQLTAQTDAADARLQAARQAVKAAEAEIRVAESQLGTNELNLARTVIRAPVAGTVSARNARIGAIASSGGEPLFRIIRDGDIELVADVSESDLLNIRAGQKAQISVAGDREPLAGTVRLVSPVVDQASRLGSVHIAIDDEQRARSGMYGSAMIITGETTGLSLPLSAVTSGRDGSTVRKVDNGVVRQVSVTTGIQDGAFIGIVSGLGKADQVVARAGAFVRDGDVIRPVESTVEPAAGAAAN